MNQLTLIGLIILLGFFIVLSLVLFETDQKLKDYLKYHPEKASQTIQGNSSTISENPTK